MSFDLDAYNKRQREAFDLDAYNAKQRAASQAPAEQTSAGEAALEHYGNAATLGYLPHAQALAAKLVPDPNSDLDAKLRSQGFTVENAPEDSYVTARDKNAKRLELESQEHPVASALGTGAGIVGGALVTGAAGKALGLAGAAAPTAGGRILQGAKVGAAMGAAANPGDKEGEFDPLQIDERAWNAGKGFLGGAALTGALEAAGPIAQRASDWLKRKANEKAVAAAGATKKTMSDLGKDRVQELGREALDEGIVGPLTTPAGVVKRAEAAKEELGSKIGRLIKDADAAGAPKVDGAKVGVKLLDDPDIIAAQTTPGQSAMYSAATREAETLAKNGEMTLEEAHALRRRLDKQIKFNRKRMDLPAGEQEVLYKIRDGLNDAINEGVNAAKLPGAGFDELRLANRQYSQLSRLEDMANNRVAMNSSNRSIGLTDTIAAAGAASAGHPSLAVPAALLNKGARTFGSSLQATTADAASNLLAKTPGLVAFAKQNPLVAQVLMNRLTNSGKFETAEEDPVLQNPQIMKLFQTSPDLIESVQDPKLKAAIMKRVGRQPALAPGPAPSPSPMQRRLGGH